MPKMKSHKGASKRFRKTGKGKFKRDSNYRGHMLTKKSAKQKRNLRKGSYVSKADAKTIDKLLPY